MKQLAALFSIAIALGVTMPGAQAAPKSIRACQTISEPGSYVLERNLIGPGGGADCLVITDSGVTIDLAGFSIISSGVGGVGIRAPGGANAVRNGGDFSI